MLIKINQILAILKVEILKIINWDFRNINDHKDYVNEIIKFKPNIIINSAAIFGPENQKYYELDTKEFFNIFNVNVFLTP